MAGFITAPCLGSCYHVVLKDMLIDEAKTACRAIHNKSRLVSIETKTEHDFIRHFLEQRSFKNGKFLAY